MSTAPVNFAPQQLADHGHLSERAQDRSVVPAQARVALPSGGDVRGAAPASEGEVAREAALLANSAGRAASSAEQPPAPSADQPRGKTSDVSAARARGCVDSGDSNPGGDKDGAAPPAKRPKTGKKQGATSGAERATVTRLQMAQASAKTKSEGIVKGMEMQANKKFQAAQLQASSDFASRKYAADSLLLATQYKATAKVKNDVLWHAYTKYEASGLSPESAAKKAAQTSLILMGTQPPLVGAPASMPPPRPRAPPGSSPSGAVPQAVNLAGPVLRDVQDPHVIE